MYDDFLIRPAGGALVELTGWLVIIDYRLFVVEDARDKSKKLSSLILQLFFLWRKRFLLWEAGIVLFFIGQKLLGGSWKPSLQRSSQWL